MKKLLTMFLAMMLILTMTPAMAEKETLPAEIADLFDVPAWEEYEVPYTTSKPDKLAYIWLEHSDCGMVYLRKENLGVLCLIERNKDGEMRITARNFRALRDDDYVPIFDSDPYETDAERGVLIHVYGEDYVMLFLETQGQWRIVEIQDQKYAYMANISTNKIGYTPGEKADWYDGYAFDTMKREYAYGVYDNRFAAFNFSDFPKTIEEARAKLTNPPVTPTDFYTPETITLRAGEKYDVFSAPGRDSYRAANGKAVMSTNDWVQIFGEEDGWLLVQYDISRDRMRFGYIDASALPKNAQVQSLSWYDLPEQTLKYSVSVTDDPLASAASICTLNAGEKVRVLSSFDNWYYIEATDGYGRLLRGFVPMSCIDIVDADDMVG